LKNTEGIATLEIPREWHPFDTYSFNSIPFGSGICALVALIVYFE
jgi:hypothetical protein